MRLLLDTHIILWWIAGSKKLSSSAKDLIANPNQICFISAASLWEIELKVQVGKLSIPQSFYEILDEQDFIDISINRHHTMALQDLPDLHRDPFDRMLVAQASAENMTLISADRMILQYPVNSINAS